MFPAVGALLAALTLSAVPATAASLPGSAFDSGDGNQDGIGLDWQHAVAAGAVKESPDANDDCFVGGVKELTPNQWAFNKSAGGCTPGKSNLRVAFANPESAAATTFGHFAFFRNDTTGNSFLTFELNQLGTTWKNAANTVIPCRSTGDLLLSFEVGGSSLQTSLYRWTGDGTGPAACPNGANGTFTGSGVIPAERFQGAMNPTAIQNYVNAAAYGATFPANAFGEAAIDIPAVLKTMGAPPCFGFLQMQVHSRSSSSISSAMIDYTTPVPVNIQSCAAIGTQYQDTNGNGTRDAGEPGLAGMRAFVDLDDDGTLDAGEPSGVSDATGFYRILDVPAGSARIRQEAKAGWSCSQPSPCSYARTFTTSGNSTGNDFGNLGPSTASGTAFDDTDGDGVRDAGEPALPGATHFADLDGDGVLDPGEPRADSDGAGAFTIADIPAGTYRIRAATPASRTCTTPATCSSQHTFSSGSAVTGLVFGSYAGATIAGTVTEVGGGPLAGVQVFLDTDHDGAFVIGEPQTTTSASGAYAFTGVAPGSYDVRPTLGTGWYCASACEHSVHPTSGVTAAGRDFTLGRYGTVSGTTWDDADGDGIRDAGDNGIAGFTTWVDYDGDNALDAGEPGAVSSGTGAYSITGVRAGSWTLRQLPNGAYACRFPSGCTYALTLASGGTLTARDFGQHVDRSVSGTVYRDGDGDGAVPEAGDTGVAGWTVYSDENSNGSYTTGEPRSVTNSLGQYTLTGLGNGSYDIRLVGQTGWTCSFPSSCVATGSIGSGQSDTGKNFGVWGPVTVSGRVVEDTNADGMAGTPRDGRTVFVDTDNDGSLDAGEKSAVSAADGTYAIGGLNPGTYVVRQVLPAGWICSRPTPCSYTVSTATGTLTDRDFASYTTGTVSGTVREDEDADGSGDAALAGRTVFADLDGDGALDAGEPSAATDATGAYTLTGLVPGTRKVRQVLPAGWTQTAPSGFHTVIVSSGSSASGRDFASHTTGTIAGAAYEDADFDGSAREAGDPPLSGRDVYLDTDGDGTRDTGEPTRTTDGAGAYSFAGLVPGAYTVRPVLPATWACAYPAGCAAPVTLGSGDTATRDFGSYVGAAVSGTVFEDLDADGAAREAGESGRAGARVYLDGNADGVRQASEPTVLTDGAGDYAFSGITVQAWRVRLDLPAGSSCDRPSPCWQGVALTSGASHPGIDFGAHSAGTITGHLFTDRDANGGAQVFGENDQPERTVYLDADDDGALDGDERSVQTDDRGDYAFTGVEPGLHRVRQVLPTGWTCSTPAPCVRAVTVTSGATVAGNDFSSWTTASLTGVYFEDRDADGDYPEPVESGIAGRTVYVDADNDGERDGAEPATTTSASGTYSFDGLAPGTYVVRSEGQPTGWTCSYPSAPCATTLSVEAAERAQDVNFGAWTSGTVTGTVTRDDTDAPLAGWTVFADLDDDGARDGGEPVDTTGAAGGYSLTLTPGPYVVRQVAPSGWTCSAPTPCSRAVTVASSGVHSGRDFAITPGATLSGVVFEDLDGDGARDAGEPGRSGVQVHVDDDAAAVTGAGGAWTATTAAGERSVRIDVPAGFECGSAGGCSRTATATAGATTSDLDFAVWRRGSISGTVREDTDADGDGDAPLAGRTVFADLDGDETLDTGEPTATSAADGTYTLSGLAPRTHAVRLVPGSGATCSAPASCARSVAVTSGAASSAVDFAEWRPAAVDGVVFEDADGDGTRDGGEAGVSGITVFSDADGDGALDTGEATATTGAGGGYSLDGLRPGSHRVVALLGGAWHCACAATVTVASGDTGSRDFGGWRDSTASGVVFGDADADGADREAGESGLGDVTVYLDADGDGTRDAGERSTTTAGDGTWSLDRLAPGQHTLRVELGAGWRCTRPDPCSANVTATSGSTPVAAAFGAVAVAADLGVTLERTPATLVAGRPVSWKATVTNAGPFSATGATVEIDLPAGLAAVTWTGACTRAGNVLTCAVGDVPVGATRELTFGGDVAPDRAGSSLPVTAEVSATEPDPDASDDVATQSPPVEGVADLRTTAALPAEAVVGSTVDLVLTVANHGPSDAGDVVLVGELPEGLDPIAAKLPAGCTVTGRTLTCVIGDLPVGGSASRTVEVVVGPNAAGPLIVPVAATSDLPDPTPADAEAEVDFTAVPAADVEVVVSEEPHLEGEGYEYELTVTNRGPSKATGVVVTDGPWDGAHVVSVTTSHGTCAVQPDGSLRCELGELPDGAEVTITVVLGVDDGADPSSIEIAPGVDAAEGDPAEANNAATAVTLPPRAAPPEPEEEKEPEPEVEQPAPKPEQPQPEPEPQREVAPELVIVAPAEAPRPAPGSCGSKRAFPVKVRRLRGHRLVKVTMTLDGVALKVRRRDGRFTATVDLRGRPRGEAVLRIRARTSRGRVLTGVRRYHTCTEEPIMGLPPL